MDEWECVDKTGSLKQKVVLVQFLDHLIFKQSGSFLLGRWPYTANDYDLIIDQQ